MSSNTKIIVLKAKELIYGGILFVLGILLALLLIYMFTRDKESGKEDASTSQTTQETAVFMPGVYSTCLSLGGTNLELQTNIDESGVTSLSLVSLDETVAAMYPLMQPTLDEINRQLANHTDLDSITCSADSKYTTILILEAAREAEKLARK
ncbi:MAG: hypothetical protein ACI4EK_02025 [Wujia sp.]